MHDHSYGWALEFLRSQFVILSFITVKGQSLVAPTSQNTMNFAFISCLCIPLQEQSEDQQLLLKPSQCPVSKTVLWDVEKVSWSTSQQLSFPDKFPGEKITRKAQKKRPLWHLTGMTLHYTGIMCSYMYKLKWVTGWHQPTFCPTRHISA